MYIGIVRYDSHGLASFFAVCLRSFTFSEYQLSVPRTGVGVKAGWSRRFGIPSGGNHKIRNLREGYIDGNIVWKIYPPRRGGDPRHAFNVKRPSQLRADMVFRDDSAKTFRVALPSGAVPLTLGLS
jgi:hypothetical protein